MLQTAVIYLYWKFELICFWYSGFNRFLYNHDVIINEICLDANHEHVYNMYFGVSDDRKVFQKLIDDMLLDEKVSHRLIRHIILRLLDLHSDHEPLVTHLAETIADIREPMTSVEKRPGEDERRQNDLKVPKHKSGNSEVGCFVWIETYSFNHHSVKAVRGQWEPVKRQLNLNTIVLT